MKGILRSSYAGQIKAFLGLLVVFLGVAIYFDVHLLIVARNAVLDEAAARLGLEADLARAELERDQLMRGLQAPPGVAPYIPPTYLDRMARLRGLAGLDLLTIDGRILSAADPGRIGRVDPYLAEEGGAPRRRLLAGETVVPPLRRVPGLPEASLAAYRPVRDRARAVVAFIRVEREVPALAGVDFNLRTLATLQAAGLLFVLVLVILFAQWLLRPYRRLQEAAIGAVPDAGGATAEVEDADALVGAFQGVLDKVRAQEAELLTLKRAGAGAGALPGDRLLGGMVSAALVFGADGRLLTLNAAAARLLGLEAGMTGRPAEQVLASLPRLAELVRAALASGAGRTREVLAWRGADGRRGHLGAMLSPIRAADAGPEETGGVVEGVVCLLTDLTEIRTLRERARLRDNLASLGEMSAGIAHEFRNALAVILARARLAARAAGPAAPAREHAEAILAEGARLQAVVNDFLRFARPQTPDRVEIDLRALVEDLAAAFRADPERAAIVLRVEGVFPRLNADETILRQALQNLLANAADALLAAAGRGAGEGPPAGGEEAPPTIAVVGSVEGGERGVFRLDVVDNGPGIPAEDLPHVFTPFFTTKESGTGLGLALVQKAAALHDGQVEADSARGRGTRITLVLPLRPAPPGAVDLVA